MRFEDEMQLVAEYAQGCLLAGTIGDVGVLLFNQPQKRNAISQEMWEGLRSGRRRVRVRPRHSPRRDRRRGRPGLRFRQRHQPVRRAGAATPRRTSPSCVPWRAGRASLSTMAKPTIACIQGFCLGGGLATALLADLRVADRSAVFGIPAARLGIAYGIDETQDLVAAVGPSRARLMLYTARRFDATEANTMGLVDVLADDAASEALALAQTIAGNAPLSVEAAKFSVAQAQEPPHERDAAKLLEMRRRCIDSADLPRGPRGVHGQAQAGIHGFVKPATALH